MNTKKLLPAIGSLFALVACGGGGGGSPAPAPTPAPPPARSLVVAPFLEGQYFCDDAAADASITNDEQAALLCAAAGKNAAARIEHALSALGPASSPSGNYQLGYTLDVPIFRYFKKVNGQWVFDSASLQTNLTTIADVNRPVVIYLSSNHFADTNIALSNELAKDSANLMWNRDGPMPAGNYYSVSTYPWTLVNQAATLTTMRIAAFKAAVAAICAMPQAAQAKITAVSVLGEVHELFPGVEVGPGFNIPAYASTDYSPVAVNGFRAWLSGRYGTIDQLNHDLGATFTDWSAVNPPAHDIHSEQLTSYFDHIDSSAAGFVPVMGWIYDKQARPLALSVYLDGKLVGAPQLGLNRTDATDANPQIGDPNVGYRLDLDFRTLAFGNHTLELLVSINGGPKLRVYRQSLVVGDRAQDMPPQIAYVDTGAAQLQDADLTVAVDAPADGQTLYYNPLADLWLQYRNQVVRSYLEQFAGILAGSCIPPSKVFSHQVTPSLYGSWNGDLLAADASKLPSALYNQGTTLYGGAAFGSAFLAMKKRLGWDRYSVSEMNPSVPLSDANYAAMFEMHRTNGAVFVAPYYLSMVPDRLKGVTGLNKYRVSPDNTLDGANLYWASMQRLLLQ